MDVYEFQESEVMFSDYSSSDQSVESDEDHDRVDGRHKHNMRLDECNKMTLKRRKSLKKMRKISSSLPIHIPNNSLRYDSDDIASPGPFDEEDDDDRMVRLPPHVIVERRRANNKEVARSLPLNERNLYQVRNCILRMKDGLFLSEDEVI